VAFLEIVSPLLASQQPINHPFVVGSWLSNTDNQVLKAILLGVAVLIILTAFGVFLRAIAKLIRRYEAWRTRQIQAALSSLGFTLNEGREGLYLRFLELFKIGQRGYSRQISNHFDSGHRAGGMTYLVDYAFVEGSGKGARAFRQTLAVIFNQRLEIPVFVLAPQKFFSWLAQRFGAHDINFEGFPRFNGTFKLQSDDEAAVRAVFTKAVIRELERHPGITLEGRPGHLLIFRLRKRVAPKTFPGFTKKRSSSPNYSCPEIRGRDAGCEIRDAGSEMRA
jgi:hypothetical protein